MKLVLIRRARIPHRKFWTRANIVINPENGKIVKIYKFDSANKYILTKVETIVNAKERLVIPVAIDLNNDLCLMNDKKAIQEISETALKGGVLISTGITEDMESAREKVRYSKIKTYIYLKSRKFIISRDMFTEKNMEYLGLYIKPEESDKKALDSLKDVLLAVDVTNMNPSLEYETVRRLVDSVPRIHFLGVKNPATIGFLNSLIKEGLKKTYDVPLYEILYLEGNGNDEIKLFTDKKTQKMILARLLRKNKIFAISTGYRCSNTVLTTMLAYYFPLYFTLCKKLHITKPLHLINPISINPGAIIYGKKVVVKVGKTADLLIFNPRPKWKTTLKPLENLAIKGRIELAVLNGKILQTTS